VVKSEGKKRRCEEASDPLGARLSRDAGTWRQPNYRVNKRRGSAAQVSRMVSAGERREGLGEAARAGLHETTRDNVGVDARMRSMDTVG
jgi:hypothetical protein